MLSGRKGEDTDIKETKRYLTLWCWLVRLKKGEEIEPQEEKTGIFFGPDEDRSWNVTGRV